jgi:ketosteroid isomerase-like protein
MFIHFRSVLDSVSRLSRTIFPCSVALALMVGASTAQARPHKCIDAQGKVTYSDTLCPATRNSERPAALDSTQRISVQQIEAMMSAADDAARRKDFEKLMSFYADDAVVEFVVRMGHRTGRRALRKRELFEYAKQHTTDVGEHSARRDKMSIDIAPNGTHAEIRSKVTENWQKNGQRMTMTYDEQNLLELRDGKLQVIKAYVISEGGPRELP